MNKQIPVSDYPYDILEPTYPIKNTKSIIMRGNKLGVEIQVISGGVTQQLFIPMRTVFQLKRGLISYIQKYYRKKVSK